MVKSPFTLYFWKVLWYKYFPFMILPEKYTGKKIIQICFWGDSETVWFSNMMYWRKLSGRVKMGE